MTETVRFRAATPDDDAATLVIFHRSISDDLRPGRPPASRCSPMEPPIEEAGKRWTSMYAHLREYGFRALRGRDLRQRGHGLRPLDRARRGEELTEFFIDPGTQQRGVGRRLLERGFHIEPFWAWQNAPVVRYDRYITAIPPAMLR